MSEIFDPLKAFDEGAEHARLQRVCTIAQLAHEWAKARRARLTLPVVGWKACEEPEPEDAEDPERPCFDSTDPNMTSRQHIGPMCPPCRARAEYHNAKLTLARKLSGLSARLERACLGPRPKSEPVCPACGKGKDGCACTVEEREAAYTVTL